MDCGPVIFGVPRREAGFRITCFPVFGLPVSWSTGWGGDCGVARSAGSSIICASSPMRARLLIAASPFVRLRLPTGSPSCWNRPVTVGEPRPSFHVSMILFDDIVQVFALPQPATSPDDACLLQVADRRWISAVLIYVDHPRHPVA